MSHNTFTDAFLDAMGAWQRGWKEKPALRNELTCELLAAIRETNLPPPALTADVLCFRKRFLRKDGADTGDDHVPLFLCGRYDEGVASWSTKFEWLKTFKGEVRDNANTAIFAHKPAAGEVVLNIEALWRVDDFVSAVLDYESRGGKAADALLNFKDTQGEIVLNAPLILTEIETFCERIGSFEQLFAEAGISGDQQEDELGPVVS